MRSVAWSAWDGSDEVKEAKNLAPCGCGHLPVRVPVCVCVCGDFRSVEEETTIKMSNELFL